MEGTRSGREKAAREIEVVLFGSKVQLAKPLIMQAMAHKGRLQTRKGVVLQSVSLQSLLRYMPDEWKLKSENIFANVYGEKMVRAVFQAITELVGEGKLKFDFYLEPRGHSTMFTCGSDKASVTPLGSWQIAVSLPE